MNEFTFYSQKWTFDIVKENYCKFHIQIHDVIENQGIDGDGTKTLEILEWLYGKIGVIDEYHAFPCAAKSKQLAIMKWLKTKGVPMSHALLRSAEGGDLEQIQWLLNNGCERDENTIACAVPNRVVVEFFLSKGFTLNSLAMANMSEKGTFEDMQWLQSLGCPIEESSVVRLIGFFQTTDMTAEDLQKVEWLLNQITQTSESLSRLAARRGDLALLKLLKVKKCKFDPGTFKYALERDKIDNVKWLCEIKCPKGKNYMKNAKSEEMRAFLSTI